MSDISGAPALLLRGQHSSLHVSFNDHAGNYMTAAQAADPAERYYDQDDWVSEEERLKAIETESVWSLRWFPNTPVGHHRVLASSFEACLAAPVVIAQKEAS